MNTIKNWLLGLFLAFAIFGSVVGALDRCSSAEGAGNGARVESVLVIRHDTLNHIDTVLKGKTKWIDTSKIIVVHDTFNTYAPEDSEEIANDDTQVITDGQLRTAMKWKDSLTACTDSRKVDSATIDTLSKLAKKVDTIKACTFSEQAKSFGICTLFGIAIRSLF